ncbi:LysE family translocator [Leucobacter denitrificans]|uniref:LysE family translocator n=1 Tax=Leucobacter denitrificans TaxID=683042 RepID=A0A7G9S596_9MICO|nr:LysE family translocator [Leucobacter denitrificans]QNN63021.1 LysE family translocator [Leucobacter denitrificans]
MIETTMTAASWVTLLTTFAIAIVVPGPDTFLLLRLGVRERRAAVIAAVGIMIGNFLWTSASVLGLAALMRAFPATIPALQALGSAVLIWIGVQSIRSGIRILRSGAAAPVTSSPVPATRHPLALGFVTNISNPKALLFFTALFSQLLPSDATALDRTLIVVALTALGLAWFVLFALFTSTPSFQRWFRRATPYFDLAAGLVFLAVAGLVLFELALTVT